jgi:hypothetical protein
MALHLGLIFGLVWHLRATPPPAAKEPQAARLIYTLSSQEQPDRPLPPAPSLRVESHPVAEAAPLLVKTPAPVSPQEIKPAAPAPSFALKDHAQADVRLDADPVGDSGPVQNKNSVVFVLDISGSMYEAYAGSTRLAVARALIRQRIESLQEGTPFAEVVYGETSCRSGSLVRAKASTRATAERFIDQDEACGGGTNLPGGFAAAQDLHPSSIFLVTDGDLNMTGAELLPKASRILGAPGACPALTIVAIAPRPHTDARRLLHALAEQQGGTYQLQPADGGAVLPQTSWAKTP